MELLVSHVVLSVVVGVTCLCAGWWLHGRLPEKGSLLAQNDEGLIRELLSKLHGLSTRVAADVSEHGTKVGAVDRELAQIKGGGGAKVGELVERLISANRTVQEKLEATEGKLAELSHQMEHYASEARTDVLTGVANRRAFQEEAARCHARFRETDQAFSLIMIDIDRFKQVNDVHGHLFGDEVLRGVAEILKRQFRGCDFVTRYGGEEFTVLMPLTSVAEARRVAETVREVVQKARFEFAGKSLSLTISLGVAEILAYEGMPDVLKRADQAMYAAKQSGRNRVYWHDGTLPHPLRASQMRIVDELREVGTVLAEQTHGEPASAQKIAAPVVAVQKIVPQEVAVQEVAVQEVATTANEKTNKLATPADSDQKETDSLLQTSDVDMELLNNMGTKTMFCQDVHRRIAEFNRDNTPFSTVLLCVDECEQIPRLHGESARKVVMGVVAQAIRARLREMDLVARYDDFTFGLVLPKATLREAICIGERLRKTIKETAVQLEDATLKFTVSLGIAEVEDGDEMAVLIERVSEQLGRAQDCGGNRSGFSASALVAS